MTSAAMWNIDQGISLVENMTICHFRGFIDLGDLEVICYNNAQLI